MLRAGSLAAELSPAFRASCIHSPQRRPILALFLTVYLFGDVCAQRSMNWQRSLDGGNIEMDLYLYLYCCAMLCASAKGLQDPPPEHFSRGVGRGLQRFVQRSHQRLAARSLGIVATARGQTELQLLRPKSHQAVQMVQILAGLLQFKQRFLGLFSCSMIHRKEGFHSAQRNASFTEDDSISGCLLFSQFPPARTDLNKTSPNGRTPIKLQPLICASLMQVGVLLA